VSSGSTIEWTQATWNPTTGCDRISAGCDNCYALTMAKRLKAMGQAKYQTDGDPRTSGPGFGVATHPDTLSDPLKWRKPRTVFVNSMSDLFHARIPREFVARVFAVMAATPQHTYQVLTKRPERMARMLTDECRCGAGHVPGVHFRSDMEWAATPHSPTYVPGLKSGGFNATPWPLPNVWIGTSVEDQQRAELRIPALLDTPAAVRWLSCEPLLGPVDIFRNSSIDRDPGLDWVVVGGESGLQPRPMQAEWARLLRDECVGAGIPFFFKQWGGRTPKANGRELDGRTWDQYPRTLVGGAA
jgi:protein gp37